MLPDKAGITRLGLWERGEIERRSEEHKLNVLVLKQLMDKLYQVDQSFTVNAVHLMDKLYQVDQSFTVNAVHTSTQV